MTDLPAAALALVVLALALIGSGVALALTSRSKSDQRKLEVLRSIDGHHVRIGVTSMRKRFVIEHTGVLRVGPEDMVLLERTDKMKTALSLPVARIRWLVDPRTGQRLYW